MNNYVEEVNVNGVTNDIQDTGARELIAQNIADIAALQEAYAGFTKSDIVITPDHTQVSNPQKKTIYREKGTTSYSDYMWDGSAWQLMATYNNAIDNTPTENSENLAKSGGIWSWVSGLFLITDGQMGVIAEALLYLYSENKALRELLAGKDNAVLPVVKAQSVECDDILTLGVPNVLYSSVAGAPSAANVPDNWNEETMTVWDGCPRKIGQQYVDKVNKKVYYAVAVTGSTSDWVALN